MGVIPFIMAKKSFILHIDSLLLVKEMTDEEAGKLLKAILSYQIGEDIELDRITKFIFAPFKAQFERDEISYQKTVERNRNNGSKGGRPQNPTEPTITQENPEKPTGLNGLKKEPKKADSDSDKDSDSKNESKKDNNKTNTSSGKPDSLTFDFLELYNKFLEQKIGTTEQFSVAGRAGLSKTIGYLKSQVQKKHPDADIELVATETINAWRWVLSNFDSWDKFHQGQLKLEQINSNLINIISNIKNGTSKTPKRASARDLAAEAFAISQQRDNAAQNSGAPQD